MTSTTIRPDELPDTIHDYLSALAVRDVDAALRCFAPEAVVEDQGETFRGTHAIQTFLREAGAQFSYTTELIGAQRVDETHWVATNRLEGDLPGGIATLNYRFTLDGDVITELVIAP